MGSIALLPGAQLQLAYGVAIGPNGTISMVIGIGIGTMQLAHATIPTVNFGPANPGVSKDMSGQYNLGEKAGHAAYWAAQGHEYDPKCPSGHTTVFCKGFNDALNAEYAFDSS